MAGLLAAVSYWYIRGANVGMLDKEVRAVSWLVRYPFYLRGRSLRAQVVPSVIV
jgi:hypothetical protein